MIVHAVNEDLVIEEAANKKPLKRRVLVASLLALAAFGAHQLHGRMQPVVQQELAASPVITDDATQALPGPNSLFGDTVVDHNFDAPVASSFGSYEMDLASTVDQGGLARETTPTIDGLDSASIKSVDVEAGSITPVGSAFSAVPEPTSAGLLLLVAAPVLGLRRARTRV